MKPRMALAAAVLGLVTATSYVAQRLLAGDDAPASAVIAQEHIPYYWRCALALLHGVLLASIVGLGVRDPAPALSLVGRLTLVVAPLLAVASLLVP